MFCVLAEADRRLSNGDTSSAPRLIGLVNRHPGAHPRGPCRDRLDPRPRRHRARRGDSRVGPDEGMDLDAVIERLIPELGDLDTRSPQTT
jgi:hypothetical protein